VCIPQFNSKDKNHLRLAELSRTAHKARAKNDAPAIQKLEGEIDRVAGKVWHLVDEELRDIQESLLES